jgi:FkbM family methyltransferase
VSCTVADDYGVRVPLRERTGLTLLGPRTALREELRSLLPRRAGAVVDVGANIGSVLVSLLRLGYRDRQYIAFEPQVEAAAYIRALIAVNAPLPASVVPVGLSDVQGSGVLYRNETGDVCATTDANTYPARRFATVEYVAVSTGDALLASVKEIAVLKIDVERGELKVLRGLRRTIERCRPAVVIEIQPYARLLDGTYGRQFYGGELSLEVRQLRADFIRASALGIEAELRQYGYTFIRDGAPVGTLDPGDGGIYDCVALPPNIDPISAAGPPSRRT